MGRVKEKKATLICFTMWMLIAMTATQGNLSSEEVNGKTFMNPESFMNISERIRYWGYYCEEYDIVTEDGYYLNVNRIPGGNKSAILLMHALVMEGSVWISNLPHQSLGFILADAGYDVWIGNYRGNSWSRGHTHLSVNETEFWNFSFHEIGIYDLSAMTEFILQKTGQQKIFYAGHAVGSLIAFVGFSVLPHLAEKIKMFFALGPAYTFQKAISPIIQILRLPEVLIKSRSDVYISHFPDYTSVKHIIHLGQVMKSGLLRYFDYGLKNIDIYHQKTPPFYRIEDITVPVAIWSGGQDWVCRPNEIAQLWSRTTNLVYNKGFPDWTHWDFIWGIDAHQRAYKDILGLMEKYV
ncbi:lipase member M-like isoform X2 [Pseudonaja textilis]|uniref:lipase member M-like isoform X2 n=1 Tax=Pseudonaja textilis TaxID=8673 RepID=UPI000EA938C3|nr:lipase member M-like isoform X2 [Pseudonaja textilis]